MLRHADGFMLLIMLLHADARADTPPPLSMMPSRYAAAILLLFDITRL